MSTKRKLTRHRMSFETLEDRRLMAGVTSIEGTKWNDQNKDRVRDRDEVGFPEVTIYLDTNNNGQLDSGETSVVTQDDNLDTPIDETGQFRFTELDEGTYRLREVVPEGSEPTWPRHDGNEQVVNPIQRHFAQSPHVSVSVDGHSVVSYQDDEGALWYRRFDAHGNPTSEPTQVSLPGDSTETFEIAVSQDGELVIGWLNFGDSVSLEIRRFAADGSPIGEPVTIPGVFTTSISIGVSADGSGVIGWTDSADGRGVLSFHQFDANGQLSGDRIDYAPIGRDVHGGQLVTTTEGMTAITRAENSDGQSLVLQRFSSQGETIGQGIMIPSAGGVLSDPAIASSTGKSAVVVFSQKDGSGVTVMAQRINEGGELDGASYQVAALRTDQVVMVGVQSDALGNQIVIWHDGDSSVSDQQVMARHYDADGNAPAAAFQVNGSSNHKQPLPDVASGLAGHSVVVYNGAVTNGADVMMRRYAAPGESGSHDVTTKTGVPFVPVFFGNEEPLISLEFDWGDAPDSYKTVRLSSGPRHRVVPQIRLGGRVDEEFDGKPSSDALGDGITDDDGVVFLTALVPGQNAMLDITASRAGFISGWIDFNGDGQFDDRLAENGGERILSAQALNRDSNQLSISIPASASSFPFARFRYSVAGGILSPVGGPATIGEVEDYALFDFGDADGGGKYPTKLSQNGARHLLVAPYLGTANPAADAPSPEIDARISPIARGDHNEAGVKFGNVFPPGMATTITVQASGSGFLDAFVDFNNDGDWDDSGEQIFNKQPLAAGDNVLPDVAVPKDAYSGVKYARFRISTIGGLGPRGLAPNGEVEDYAVGLLVNSTRDSSANDADDTDLNDGLCYTGGIIQRPSASDPNKFVPEPECTLRAAIQQTNAIKGLSPIGFNIPQNDPHFGKNSPGSFTIELKKELDAVTQPVFLDATTQPGFIDREDSEIDQPAIELDLNEFDGLTIKGGDSTIKGLVINGALEGGAALHLLDNGGNNVEKNFIGTDVTGNEARNEKNDGLRIKDVPDNLVKHNLISGNAVGVFVALSGATGNKIEGNYIGTDINGTIQVGNVQHGVKIQNASNNTIGGDTKAARNIISGNGAINTEETSGLLIRGDSARDGKDASGNKVQGNYIGLNKDGDALVNQFGLPVGNVIGVSVVNASENLIGGEKKEEGNVISSNHEQGILIQGTADKLGKDASKNKIQGNYIGTDIDGKESDTEIFFIGNINNGIVVRNASENEIGGKVVLDAMGDPKTGVAPGNVISGNRKSGIRIEGAKATNNKVQGNRIGVSLGGDPLSNAAAGVWILDATDTQVGQRGSAMPGPSLLTSAEVKQTLNIIAHNEKDGVTIEGDDAKFNTIRGNEIYRNQGLGINLKKNDRNGEDGDGVTPNDHAAGNEDKDTGPNELYNFPVGVTLNTWASKNAASIREVSSSISGLVITSDPTTTVVDIYATDTINDTEFGGGREFLGSAVVDASGQFSLPFVAPLPHPYLSATATGRNGTGSTSEFSFVCGDPDGDGKTDTDGDGLCDVWERFGIDLDGTETPGNGIDDDGNGTVDDVDLMLHSQEYDTVGVKRLPDWNHKDLFVEVDILDGRQHAAEIPNALGLVKTAFQNSPVVNGDGVIGINLHVEISDDNIRPGGVAVGAGHELDFSPAAGKDNDFNDVKLGNNAAADNPFATSGGGFFGTLAERTDANKANILGARRLVFRYTLFANQQAGTTSPGRAEIGGNDVIIAVSNATGMDGIVRKAVTNFGAIEANEWRDLYGDVFMHEFGHTLGLGHGGNQFDGANNYKPNYLSIMNYAFQYNDPGFDRSLNRVRLGRPLDYSRGLPLPPLNEMNLNEAIGIAGPAGRNTIFRFQRPRDARPGLFIEPANGTIDWDMDGNDRESAASVSNNDINRHTPNQPALTGHDD